MLYYYLKGDDKLTNQKDVSIRIKELRLYLHMTQKDFGEKISVAQTYLSQIEKGDRPATEKIIKIILLEDWDGKTVNETWLQTGEGEMFIERSEEEEIADLVYELMDPKGDDFYIAVLELIRTYQELSPSSQQIIKETASKFMNNLKKSKGD